MKFEEWIKNKHIPFKPNGLNGNYDDFKPLSKIIENTRVVAIGENSHFIKEFFLLRHNLLQFFIEELGFTTFAFEFGFQYIPQRTGNAYRRECTGNDTNNQRCCKFTDRRNTENEQCCDRDERCQRSIDTSCKSLCDTSVYDLFQCFVTVFL